MLHYSCISGKQALSDCVSCPSGQYCYTSGNDTITGDCDPGFYCILEAMESNPTGKSNKQWSLCYVTKSYGSTIVELQILLN